MPEILNRLAALPAELVWGLFTRGIALVYLISFLSLSGQALPIAGSKGASSVAVRLDKMREHFPTWRRFFYFPTLQWLFPGDAALRAFPLVGAAAAVSVVVGGPHSPWALLLCYVIYLSLDRALVFIYPWDCLLFEAGFWAMFLPATHALPELTATAAPLPAVAWVHRLLVFRLLFGFGKFKFIGSTPRDTGYLKSFFINQPLPSPIGWFSQKLPMPVMKVALLAMFVVEMIVPFFVFAPGPWSVLGALVIDGLMLGIWAAGNFGYFNVAVIVLSLSWFDTATARALDLSALIAWGPETPVHALVVIHTLGVLLSFPLNSFCANTWLLWPVWQRLRPRFLEWPFRFYRALHPFRWLHAYGVFPPHTVPGVKMVPVLEVSDDGKTWRDLVHRYSPTQETSPPCFCAPHHARLDQALIYEAFGLNDVSVLRNLVGWWEPYGHGRATGAALLARRVLEGTLPDTIFRDGELSGPPPQVVRVRTHMLEPASLEELRRSGRWWRRSLVGPHLPPMRLTDGFWGDPFPEPEQWHFDDVVWLRRSNLNDLMVRARRGEDVHSLVLERAADLSAADRERFWSEFVPEIRASELHDWKGLRGIVERARAKYGRPQLYRFERLVGRYGVLLFAKLEGKLFDEGLAPIFGLRTPELDVKTPYHLRLLCQHLIGEGRSAYDAVVADTSLAAAALERMSLQSGSAFSAIFKYEVFVFQAQKLRLLDKYLEHENRPRLDEKTDAWKLKADEMAKRLFGAVEMVNMLKGEFSTDEDVIDVPERYPTFAWMETGEIQVLRRDEESPGT